MNAYDRKHRQGSYTPFYSFLFSLTIILFVYILRGITPFGGESLLRNDLYHQYAPFLAEYRNRILHGQSLFYSWQTALGKDFFVQTAYYTASPLNLFSLLFPETALSECISFLTALRLALCSASFSFYLSKRPDICRQPQRRMNIILFGTLYGFCGFLTFYYWNIMWLDTVILFPVAILGLERLIRQGRHTLYYISLLLTMLVNFYLAVIVCIFLALYVVVLLLSEKNDRALQRFGTFVFISGLAALSASAVLLPVFLALKETAVSESASAPGLYAYSNIVQLLNAHFAGAHTPGLAPNDDIPNLHSGVLAMLLFPLYLSCKAIPPRERLLKLVLLLFLLACCCIAPLDYLAHGLHSTANVPHRFVFIYSFFLLTAAYEAFSRIRDCSVRWSTLAAFLYLLILPAVEFWIIPHIEGASRVLDNSALLINAVLIVIYLAILTLLQRPKLSLRPHILGILFLLCAAESAFSLFIGLDETTSREEYVADMGDMRQLLSAENSEGYRTEFFRFRTLNDGSLYHYSGLTGFSSLMSGSLPAFLKNIGISATSNSCRYYDSTPLTDAIFAIRYIADRDMRLSETSRLKLADFDETISIYENTSVLPLAFTVDEKIQEWDTDDSNPFTVQNDFLSSACQITEPMFTPIQASSVETSYLDIEEKGEASNTAENGIVFSYTPREPDIKAFVPSITATFTFPADQFLYFYVDAENAQRVMIEGNSWIQERALDGGNEMIKIGLISAGETVTLHLDLTKEGLEPGAYSPSGTIRIYAAAYHDEVFQKAMKLLQPSSLYITEYSDTRITGTITVASSGVLFTSIPYSTGWTVKVDGEKTDVFALSGALLGVKLTKGTHTVSLIYHTPGLRVGLCLSILGIALYFLFAVRRRRES